MIRNARHFWTWLETSLSSLS